MELARDLLLVAAAYVLGALSPGYYAVRLLKKVDLREFGDHSTSASNAGAAGGTLLFLCAAFLELVFGVVAALLAFEYAASGYTALAIIVAAPLGAVFPVQLRGRGGYGILTLAGMLFLLQPTLLLSFLCAWGVFNAFMGGGKIPFLISITSLPLLAHLLQNGPEMVVGMTAAAAVLLAGQRREIRALIERVRGGRPESESPK